MKIKKTGVALVLIFLSPYACAQLSTDDGTWTGLSFEGPSRHTFASSFDSSRGNLLVFGGSDGLSYRNETYALTLSTAIWTQLEVSGPSPSPRRLVEGVYDPVRDRFIVFGGFGDDGFHNDVWALALSGTLAWTDITPSGPAPSPRAGHAVVYDPVADRMILFGGFDPTSPASSRNDVWELSFSGRRVWRQLSPLGIPPTPRSSHSAVYDTARRRLLVFGGGLNTAVQSEVWALSLGGVPAWTQISTEGPAPVPREEQAAIYDPVRQRLLISWGYQDVQGPYLDDVWALPLVGVPRWAQLAPSGDRPYARWGHGAIYDPAGDRLVVHGGQRILHETWALTLAGSGPNSDPDCSHAVAVSPHPWPSRKLGPVVIDGVIDPDGDAVTITVTDVTQDEPLTQRGDPTCPDATLRGEVLQLRNESDQLGDGRVYRISFTARDGQGGSCASVVSVCVPAPRNGSCLSGAPAYSSFGPCSGP